MYRPFKILGLCALPAAVAAQGNPAPGASQGKRLCIAPATIESAPNATEAATAVRDAFTGMLTGPGIAPVALQSKLQSLVRQEAKQGDCSYLLIPTFKHVHKTSGGGVLGKAALGAVQSGAYQAGGVAAGTAARVAVGAAQGAANQAASNYAYSTKTKDEMTLGYRLESASGQVLLEEKNSRKAESDGEDMLSPLVQQAAEKIAVLVTKTG
jgi:hypothetical protein